MDYRIEIENIIKNSNVELENVDSIPFSDSAYNLLRAKIREYISLLVSESSKVSRRFKADTISAAYVERASEHLISSTTKKLFRHLGTVGGVFLGASLSSFLSMATANQFTTLGTLVSAGLGIVGAFLIALNIAKDF